MEKTETKAEFFGQEKVWKILLKIAPPVMLAQLIQALYNIVDSLFVGRYAETGLTALSIVYPLQLLMPAYARMSSSSPEVVGKVVTYGRIVCVFSFGLFFESIWTKILQSEGDMRTPMAAQVLGAVTNIVLDPILIFSLLGAPQMGIAGAAIATVIGQMAAALVVMKKGYRGSPAKAAYPGRIAEIFRLGIPNILMQCAYTFYILGLNLILSGFSDQAVTALGLYYKCFGRQCSRLEKNILLIRNPGSRAIPIMTHHR